MNAYYPVNHAVGLVSPHIGLLYQLLADRLDICPILLLQWIFRKCTKESVDRLQIPIHIAQLLSYGDFQLRAGLFLLLRRIQISLPYFLPISSELHRP